MNNVRVIWSHEVNQANDAAKRVIETKRVAVGWKVLLFPFLLLDYYRYKKSLLLTRKNFLFTKRLAFEAAKEMRAGKARAMQMRLIEIRTNKILVKEKKGYYTEKIRRKQMREIEVLIDHYLELFKSNKTSYPEIVKAAYFSEKGYLAFIEKLQRAEKEVIEAAIATMRRGSKKERLRWFAKIQETFRNMRLEEADWIFTER